MTLSDFGALVGFCVPVGMMFAAAVTCFMVLLGALPRAFKDVTTG